MSPETTGVAGRFATTSKDHEVTSEDRYSTICERNEQVHKLNEKVRIHGWEGQKEPERGEEGEWEASELDSEEGCEGNEYEDQDREGDDEDAFASEELLQKLFEIEFSLASASFARELDTSREKQAQFLQDYGRYIGEQPPPKTDNVLHFMAGKRSVSVWLLRYMLEHCKGRMADLDDARRHPLLLAIELNKELFIETLLESSYDGIELERILRMETSDVGNGIHAAINAGLSPGLTVALINKVSDDVLSQKDGAGCTPLHRAVEYERCREGQVDVVRALLDRGDSALDERTKEKLSVYQYHFSTRPAEENTTTGRIVHKSQLVQQNGAKKKLADMIAEEVKLWYLRSTFEERGSSKKQRSHDTAMEFLGVDGQTRHICFNLLQRDRPMRQRSLTKGAYSQFVFDTTLQFVALGPFVLSDQNAQAALEGGCGRRDMVAVFKWLKTRKVMNIIKVIVDDCKLPSHSDEAIVEALRSLNIDILDWSKPDLRPETIQQACRNVRKLYLSWSGLVGVLVAWGGRNGLAKLPYLTDVYIRQTGKQLDSEEWASRKLDEFEKLLKSSRDCINGQRRAEAPELELADWPLIKVHRLKAQIINSKLATPAIAVTEQSSQEPVVKDHQWLEIMDRFAKAICDLPPDRYVKGLPNLPPELKRDVRVCLIDDGVDADHPSISQRMDYAHGKAFGTSPGEEHRGLVLPFYESATRLGTVVANMITRVCPYAKIVSYRLDARQGEDGRPQFTAKSAADALEHAAKQDFDIISMSWTVRQLMGSGEDNSDIHRLCIALDQVVRDKLVFCSSPDVGNISFEELATYHPVGSEVEEIFRIGAATADNSRWKPSGGKRIVDYIFPGHGVREAKGCEVFQENTPLKPGSWIATGLAAGLAALLIHIVRMAAIHTYLQGKENSREANLTTLASLETVKSFEAMRRTFDIMANKAAGKSYVHVWGYFDQTCLEFEAADNEPDAEAEKWRIILELARDIVPRRTWRRPAAGKPQTASAPDS
ncbi:hypothetical protein C8A03DRAFT_30246 [Achaetomium macrosporum]|uniref:Peptidase S8/S53 domain-containing protein n=1 Tax=Achaetomium macrosporum TaxID=79813 RepID=A0AAN7CGA8_9PEZI|nr:hypothetical protein C8A03DRAFT_30246 [Achaetomium macrosporum]